MWKPPADQVDSEPIQAQASGWKPPADQVVAPPEMGGSPPLGYVAKQVLGMTPMAHPIENLPVLGAVLGGGPGAALGEAAREGIDVAGGNYKPTPGETFRNVATQGMLAGIPETPGFKSAAQYVGKGLAKAGKTLSGVKEDILSQAAKQGYSTYGAPSLESAGKTFGEAVGPEGKAALEQSADDVFDPALGRARATAKDVGAKMDAFLKGSGEPPTAIEALQAKQATDRIISATPVTDKLARRALYDYRTKFDSLMSSQSGDLGDASKLYRKAIVKDTLMNPTRLTKSGEPSAFLPLVLGAGDRGVLGIASTLTGTSPALWGLGATTAGQIAKTSPVARRAVISAVVDRFVHGGNQ